MLKIPKKSIFASAKRFVVISYCFHATLPSTLEIGENDRNEQLGIQLHIVSSLHLDPKLLRLRSGTRTVLTIAVRPSSECLAWFRRELPEYCVPPCGLLRGTSDYRELYTFPSW